VRQFLFDPLQGVWNVIVIQVQEREKIILKEIIEWRCARKFHTKWYLVPLWWFQRIVYVVHWGVSHIFVFHIKLQKKS